MPTGPGSSMGNGQRTHSYCHRGGETPLLGDTIPSHFENIVSRFGEREAVVSVHQQRRLTYAQLKNAVDELARGLLGLGFQKGERLEDSEPFVRGTRLRVGPVPLPEGARVNLLLQVRPWMPFRNITPHPRLPPAVVVQGGGWNPSERYIGQDFVTRTWWGPDQLYGNDRLSWWLYRKSVSKPTPVQRVVLWIKTEEQAVASE